MPIILLLFIAGVWEFTNRKVTEFRMLFIESAVAYLCLGMCKSFNCCHEFSIYAVG
jgi:hypothetical protein